MRKKIFKLAKSISSGESDRVRLLRESGKNGKSVYIDNTSARSFKKAMRIFSSPSSNSGE